MEFFETDNEQRIDLDDGTYLHLILRTVPVPNSGLTMDEYNSNIFRVTKKGKILWKIKTDNKFLRSSYTELYVQKNPKCVFHSSGFRCTLNLETGIAEPCDYPILGSWVKRPLPPEYPAKRFFERNDTEQRVYLDDGTYLFLAQRGIGHHLTGLTPEDYARNVFRMTEDGEVLWTIKTDRDSYGSPFTELFLDEDPRKMANWDGLDYLVNLETGEAESYAYSR